jgi:hypothetical protein
MLRLVIENVLLFLAPTLLYVGYALLRRNLDDGGLDEGNKDSSTGGAAPNSSASVPNLHAVLNDAPVVWLAMMGAGLVFAVLLIFGSVSTSDPNGTYEPAVYKDGKIIPGRIK